MVSAIHLESCHVLNCCSGWQGYGSWIGGFDSVLRAWGVFLEVTGLAA